jgi:hypothetical protein
VLREELNKPNPDKASETRYHQWIRMIVEDATKGGTDAKMEIMRFLEGTAPVAKPDQEALEEPEATDEHGNTLNP